MKKNIIEKAKTMNIFNVLAIFMMGFGFMMGVVFPFFVFAVTNVPKKTVLNPLFFVYCISAGLLVGLFNIYLAKSIVGKKTKILSTRMKYVEDKLKERSQSGNKGACTDDNCYIETISKDEIGESAKSFNSLVRSLHESMDLENALREFSEMLSSCLELDLLSNKALEKLIESMHAVAGMIIMDREGEIEILSSYGFSNLSDISSNDIIRKIFRDKKRKIINFPEQVYLDGIVVDFKPKSIVVEPIIYKDVVLGLVVLAFTDESVEAAQNMQLYSHGLALAFKNAITHDQLQKLAAKDPLTGVFNRRFGLTRFREEYVRAIKSNQPLGVLMLDLDHFKRVNDTYGHIVGDKVLISVVNQVKLGLREGDIFIRYGGEEFLVILPGASLKDIKMVAEQVRRIVEESDVKYNNQTIKTTISIGAASFPQDNATDDQVLLEMVDTRLYTAKERGRNIVVSS